MNLRFLIACLSVFSVFAVLGLAVPSGIHAWSHSHAGQPNPPPPEGSPIAVVRGTAESEVVEERDACLNERRALSELKQGLERRRHELAMSSQAASSDPADERRPESADLDDTRQMESRMRVLLESQKLTELSVDCGEPPCLVFGVGKREIVEPFAEAMAAHDEFAALRPVVVSRVVVDRERHPDTVTALALMGEEEYADEAARAEFEAMLRRRVGRLQE